MSLFLISAYSSRRRDRPRRTEKPVDPDFDIDPPSPTPFIHGPGKWCFLPRLTPALPGKAFPPAPPRADKTAEAGPHIPHNAQPQSTLPPHVYVQYTLSTDACRTAALAANRGGDTLLSPLAPTQLPPLLAQTKGLKTPLEAELARGVGSPLSAAPRSPARPNEIYPLQPLQTLQPFQPTSASPLTPSPQTPFSPFTQERDAGVVVEDGVMEFIPPSYDPAWAASREGRIAAAAAGYGTVVRQNS